MGTSYGANLSLSRAPSEKLAFRIAGGFFHSDEFARPAGTVPRGTNPAFPDQSAAAAQTGGAPYPTYQNTGTNQPKVDLRVDQDLSGGARLTYSAGYASTSGMIHTGIGPFEMQDGSYLGYGRVGFTKNSLRVTAFTNLLDVDAPNRVFKDPATGADLPGRFKTKTFDIEGGNAHLIGSHHILSYGGNARRNNFDISIADDGDADPTKSTRDEFGAYLQDEVYYGKFRLVLGARVDKFSSIDNAMFSPRLSAVFKPMANHTLRASYNRAFRSPSVVNNYLLVQTVQQVNLSGIAPFLPPALQPAVAVPFNLRVRVKGNPDLVEDSMTAYEVGYTGTFAGKTTFQVAAYMNDVDDNINFVNLPTNADPYTSANPPPGWILPAALEGQLRLLDTLGTRGIFLPRTVATYQNLGPIRNKGVEVSLQHEFSSSLNAYVNYSWQDDPEPLDDPQPYPPEEISAPPTNRVNAGIAFRKSKVFGSASVNYSDEGFWSDVLTREYHGTTPSYTMFNATLGLKVNDRVTFSLKGTNLTDEEIQQHIFGDILKRNVVGELRLSF
jgi:outer membrane receptor protein involved in Fe transport